MDWFTLTALAMVLVQALDILGHILNGREVRALKAEVRATVKDAAEERKRIIELLEARGAPGMMKSGLTGEEVRAAREAKADLRAQTEMAILAFATESFGERWGPAVVEWARTNAVDAWNRALNNPKSAQMILSPVFALAAKIIPRGGEEKEASGPASMFNPPYGK